MNIYIDYLPDADRQRSDYLSAKRLANPDDELATFNTKVELLGYLLNKNLDRVKYISINSHGLPDPACFSRNADINNAIGYKMLIDVLNSTINGENIILNLVGICQSCSIDYYLTGLDRKFKEVWVSTDNTPSIDASFRIIKDGDFDYYVSERELPLKKINNQKPIE